MSTGKHGLYGSDPSLLSPLAARLAAKDKLKWVIALTVALGAVLEIIDVSIVNVAMPDMQGNLGATLSEIGWVSTGYACANVVIIPLSAWLGYRFGRRNYLVFSLLGFTLSSMMCGFAGSLGMLILARVLQGLCGGGLLAKAQSILFEAFPRKEYGVAQALFGIGVISGPALGPVLGGYLTDNFGWRWIFFINLPVGLFAVFMTLLFLPRDREEELQRDGRVDWWGIGLLALGLGCFQTLLEEGQQEDWFNSDFICLMAAGAVFGMALFIWRELTTEHPAVDLRVLRHKELAAGSAYSLVLGMGLYGIMFAIPVFVQSNLQFTATQSGFLLMPGACASAVTMVLMGRLAGRVDSRILICIGALGTAMTGYLLSTINPNTGTDSLFWPLILRGVATVFMFLPLSLASLGNLPKSEVAQGSGFYNLTRQMGSSLGIALITTFLAHRVAVHRAVLVEKVTEGSPLTQQRVQAYQSYLGGFTADPVQAKAQALGLVDRIVSGQATLLSFADVFYYVSLAFLVTLPLLLLLGNGRNREAAQAAH